MDEYVTQAQALPPHGQLHILIGIAFLLGLGKGGVPGLATVATAATVLTSPANVSGGLGYAVSLQVPILAMIDIYAAWLHRSSLDRPTVWLLLPMSFVGMFIGQYMDRRMSDGGARFLVGFILLGILALRVWKDVAKWLFPSWAIQHQLGESKDYKIIEGKGSDSDDGSPTEREDLHYDIEGSEKEKRSATTVQQIAQLTRSSKFGWACIVGIIGGVATMLTNSMGPIVNVYLLSVGRLSPEAYVGTRAFFFCFINIGKLPIRVIGGTLGAQMLPLSTGLGMVSIFGVMLAKPIMLSMNEKTFVKLELGVVAFAGLRLCYMGLQ